MKSVLKVKSKNTQVAQEKIEPKYVEDKATEQYLDYINESGNVMRHNGDKYVNTGINLKGPRGAVGPRGLPGKDGITPHIGENGNWYIGEQDTGNKAELNTDEYVTKEELDETMGKASEILDSLKGYSGIDEEPTADSNNLVKSGGVKKSISEIDDSIVGIEKDIYDIDSLITDVPITIHKESGSDGYWQSSNGSWVNTAERRSTDKIDVVAGEKYYVTTKIGSSSLISYLAQWNGETFVGTAEGFTGGSGNAVDRKYVVPNGVTKIAICSYNSTEPSLKKYTGDKIPNFYSKDELDESIGLINHDISILNDEAEYLKDLVTDESEEIVDVEISIHKEGDNDGYWRTSLGTWVNDNGRRGTDKIDVMQGERYLVTTRIGSSSAIAYLAEWQDNTFVGVADGFEAGSGNAVDREYVVPQGVNKIAICSYNSTEPSLKKVEYLEKPVFYNKSESDERYAKTEDIPVADGKYGVKWSISNLDDLGQRCFNAIGKMATIGIGNTDGSSDFDGIYPWSEIKRCNIKSNANGAKIVTFEGENGFTLDGSNGNVFVRIPKFCVEKYIESGFEYRVISRNSGTVHPAFIENGKELDEIFVAAFEGFIDGEKLSSRAGVIPSSNETADVFLQKAVSNGEGYSLYDMRCVDAIWSLMAVEFGCRNTNRILGYGYSDYIQPVKNTERRIALATTSTNTIIIGKPSTSTKRLQLLNDFAAGNNITICDTDQLTIVAQRKITSVECASVDDNVAITFDGSPLDVTTSMFVGNAAIDCNYCESISSSEKLNWHTGRSNRVPISGSGYTADTKNPCRYRWIENIVGNLWHFLPDVSFNNQQMYMCDNIQGYEMFKITPPYYPVGDLLPIQTNNGDKRDINTVDTPNFWMTSIFNDLFFKGSCFGKTYDTVHDGTVTSQKGFGGYYYLSTGNSIIANGGGFDHLYRSNMLTNRAWITPTSKWYLYGARLIFKNIEQLSNLNKKRG